MIPHHDPECGKNAIAANNQRQSQQQHAERNSEAHSSRDDREGAGSAKKKENPTRCGLFCFALLSPPPPAAASHPAQLSSKAAACCRVAQWGHGMLCASSRAMKKHLSMPSRPTTPTRGSSGHGHCRQDCWHTGAVVATSPVSLPARAARPLHKACHLPSSS